MPTPAATELQIVVNGGAPQTGAVTVAFEDEILLKLASSAGVKSVKYQIWEYPEGFDCPAGWQEDASGKYFALVANGGDAPAFDLPASDPNLWGNYMFSATVNNRLRNGRIDNDLHDESTCCEIPSATGVKDVAYLETNQFDPKRQWAGALKGLVRAFDAAVFGGGGVTDHGALSGRSDDDHTQYDLSARPLSAYSGASNATVLADARKHITTSHGSACGLTIPANASVAYAVGTLLLGTNIGAGSLTLAAAGGVTLNGSLTVPQWGWWWAKKVATDTWDVFVGGSAGATDHGALSGLADDDHTQYLRTNGARALTGDQSFGGFKATNLATPSASTDAATKAYVDSAVASAVDWKPSVRAATTANITLSGAQTIDAVSVSAGDRVLVKNQSTGSQNGIYVAAAGAWSRATDADADAEVTSGLATVVEEGTANGGKIFLLTTANPIVVGTTALSFTALSGGGVTDHGALTGLSDDDHAIYTKADGTRAFSGNQSLGNNSLTSVKAIGFNSEIAHATPGATETIDFTAGPLHSITLDTATVAITLTPPSAPGHFQLNIFQDATGNRKATWAASSGSIVWITSGGSAPRLSTIASGTVPDVVTGYWNGSVMYLAATTATPGPVVGSDLAAATTSINISQGSQRTMPRATTTGAQVIDVEVSGTPEDDEAMEITIYEQAHEVKIHNNGPIDDDLWTIASGTRRTVQIFWNGTDWRKGKKIRAVGT